MPFEYLQFSFCSREQVYQYCKGEYFKNPKAAQETLNSDNPFEIKSIGDTIKNGTEQLE